MKYEVNFTPPKRVVRGVHQWDVAYILEAETPDQAIASARRMIAAEHPGYKLGKTRELAE